MARIERETVKCVRNQADLGRIMFVLTVIILILLVNTHQRPIPDNFRLGKDVKSPGFGSGPGRQINYKEFYKELTYPVGEKLKTPTMT